MGDAAFGNVDVMAKIQEWGGTATFSFNESNATQLWNVLSYKTPPDTWRVAINKNGYIASSHTIEDASHKMVRQQVMTTAFNGIIPPMNNNENINEDQNSSGIVCV